MKRKPRKYQSKLTLYPMTFEQVVDAVLKHRPQKKRTRKKIIKQNLEILFPF